MQVRSRDTSKALVTQRRLCAMLCAVDCHAIPSQWSCPFGHVDAGGFYTSVRGGACMLVIEAITVRGQPVADPVRATFDQGGGTIGRGSTSTLVLADPDRHISRVQATIEFQAGDYVITDTGTLNPLTVNGRPLGGGAHALLKDGDELSVGPYRLRVHVSGMVPSASAPAPRVPQVQSSGAIKDDPLEMFSGPSSSGPFDDLLPADLKLPVPQSGAGAHAQGFAPSQAQVPSAKVGGNAIPDDFNPFGEES